MTEIDIAQDAPVLVAIDIAKARHEVLIAIPGKKRRRRLTVLNQMEDFQRLITSLASYGMEACPGSQWLARKLIEVKHDARIIPARFIKAYVKSNKIDTVDAAAIAEAVTRPSMYYPASDACIHCRAAVCTQTV